MAKLLRVPRTCHTKEMLLGTVAQLEDVQNIVVIIEDCEGVWTLMLDGTTAERINWMLDRAKLTLHNVD